MNTAYVLTLHSRFWRVSFSDVIVMETTCLWEEVEVKARWREDTFGRWQLVGAGTTTGVQLQWSRRSVDGNNDVEWMPMMMRVCHVNVGALMQRTRRWRPRDALRPGNVLERGILGGAVCRWLVVRALHDGAHAAVCRHPLRSSVCSDVRRLRVRVT